MNHDSHNLSVGFACSFHRVVLAVSCLIITCMPFGNADARPNGLERLSTKIRPVVESIHKVFRGGLRPAEATIHDTRGRLSLTCILKFENDSILGSFVWSDSYVDGGVNYTGVVHGSLKDSVATLWFFRCPECYLRSTARKEKLQDRFATLTGALIQQKEGLSLVGRLHYSISNNADSMTDDSVQLFESQVRERISRAIDVKLKRRVVRSGEWHGAFIDINNPGGDGRMDIKMLMVGDTIHGTYSLSVRTHRLEKDGGEVFGRMSNDSVFFVMRSATTSAEYIFSGVSLELSQRYDYLQSGVEGIEVFSADGLIGEYSGTSGLLEKGTIILSRSPQTIFR